MGICIFPIPIMVVIPALILWASKVFSLSVCPPPAWNLLLKALAIFLFTGGFLLALKSCLLFKRIGKGTPVPWVPPRHFVVKGVYRRMRNPMLTGVMFVLLAEALFFSSPGLLVYLAVFALIAHICIVYKEETTLQKRFGDEYALYRRNVPRWIPRPAPWTPPWDAGEK